MGREIGERRPGPEELILWNGIDIGNWCLSIWPQMLAVMYVGDGRCCWMISKNGYPDE